MVGRQAVMTDGADDSDDFVAKGGKLYTVGGDQRGLRRPSILRGLERA